MKILLQILMLTLLSSSFTAIQAKGQVVAPNQRCFGELCTVTIINLMANAEKYEQKKVQVVGIADFSNSKIGALYLDEGSYKNKIYEHAISIEINTAEIISLLEEEPNLFQGKYVYVYGKYLASLHDLNGDQGGIYNVESISVIGLK